MDFSALELDEIKDSFWVHLEIEGKPLFWDAGAKSVTLEQTGAPCRVKMKSATSNEVYQAFGKYQVAESAYQARLSRAKDSEIEGIAAKHSEKAESLMDHLIVVAVEDWENIYFDGEAAKASEARVRELIDRKASFSKRAIRAQLFAAISEKRENLTDAA